MESINIYCPTTPHKLSEQKSVIAVKRSDLPKVLNLLRSNDVPLYRFPFDSETITIEMESIINYDHILFGHSTEDIWLARCLKVFEFYTSDIIPKSIHHCCQITGVSEHYVSKIYKKYINNG